MISLKEIEGLHERLKNNMELIRRMERSMNLVPQTVGFNVGENEPSFESINPQTSEVGQSVEFHGHRGHLYDDLEDIFGVGFMEGEDDDKLSVSISYSTEEYFTDFMATNEECCRNLKSDHPDKAELIMLSYNLKNRLKVLQYRPPISNFKEFQATILQVKADLAEISTQLKAEKDKENHAPLSPSSSNDNPEQGNLPLNKNNNPEHYLASNNDLEEGLSPWNNPLNNDLPLRDDLEKDAIQSNSAKDNLPLRDDPEKDGIQNNSEKDNLPLSDDLEKDGMQNNSVEDNLPSNDDSAHNTSADMCTVERTPNIPLKKGKRNAPFPSEDETRLKCPKMDRCSVIISRVPKKLLKFVSVSSWIDEMSSGAESYPIVKIEKLLDGFKISFETQEIAGKFLFALCSDPFGRKWLRHLVRMRLENETVEENAPDINPEVLNLLHAISNILIDFEKHEEESIRFERRSISMFENSLATIGAEARFSKGFLENPFEDIQKSLLILAQFLADITSLYPEFTVRSEMFLLKICSKVVIALSYATRGFAFALSDWSVFLPMNEIVFLNDLEDKWSDIQMQKVLSGTYDSRDNEMDLTTEKEEIVKMQVDFLLDHDKEMEARNLLKFCFEKNQFQSLYVNSLLKAKEWSTLLTCLEKLLQERSWQVDFELNAFLDELTEAGKEDSALMENIIDKIHFRLVQENQFEFWDPILQFGNATQLDKLVDMVSEKVSLYQVTLKDKLPNFLEQVLKASKDKANVRNKGQRLVLKLFQKEPAEYVDLLLGKCDKKSQDEISEFLRLIILEQPSLCPTGVVVVMRKILRKLNHIESEKFSKAFLNCVPSLMSRPHHLDLTTLDLIASEAWEKDQDTLVSSQAVVLEHLQAHLDYSPRLIEICRKMSLASYKGSGRIYFKNFLNNMENKLEEIKGNLEKNDIGSKKSWIRKLPEGFSCKNGCNGCELFHYFLNQDIQEKNIALNSKERNCVIRLLLRSVKKNVEPPVKVELDSKALALSMLHQHDMNQMNKNSNSYETLAQFLGIQYEELSRSENGKRFNIRKSGSIYFQKKPIQSSKKGNMSERCSQLIEEVKKIKAGEVKIRKSADVIIIDDSD